MLRGYSLMSWRLCCPLVVNLTTLFVFTAGFQRAAVQASVQLQCFKAGSSLSDHNCL